MGIGIMRFYMEYQNRRIILGSIIALAVFFTSNAKAAGAGYSQLTRNSVLESANLDKTMLEVRNIHNKQALNHEKIMQKSRELEGVFISKMIDPMFPSGKESNLFGGGAGSDIYRSMLIQQYGQVLADAGGVGLTNGIAKQITRQQMGE